MSLGAGSLGSKQTNPRSRGWSGERRRAGFSKSSGLRVDCSQPLYLRTRKKKRARRAQSTSPPPTPYPVKSSILHWRPVLSRCFPRGKRCLPRPSIRPTTLRRFVFSRSNLRAPLLRRQGRGLPVRHAIRRGARETLSSVTQKSAALMLFCLRNAQTRQRCFDSFYVHISFIGVRLNT